jgi:hypothetical protein
MTRKIKHLLFFFSAVVLFSAGTQFVFALENTYPPIPGFSPGLDPTSTLGEFIQYLFGLGVVIAGIIGVISIVIAGIRLLVSVDSPSAVASARERIFGSILGIVLLMFSVIFLGTINPSLTNLQIRNLSQNPPKVPALVNNSQYIISPENEADTSTLPDEFRTLTNFSDVSIWVWKYPVTGEDDNSDATTVSLAPGESTEVGGWGSYKWAEEQPGVYLFKGPGCLGSGTVSTQAITETGTIPTAFQRNVQSALIVNGGGDNDPSYSFVLNEDPNLKGTCSQPYSNFGPGELCVDVTIQGNCGGGGGGGGGGGASGDDGFHCSGDQCVSGAAETGETSCNPGNDNSDGSNPNCQEETFCGNDNQCVSASDLGCDPATEDCGTSCTDDSDCSSQGHCSVNDNGDPICETNSGSDPNGFNGLECGLDNNDENGIDTTDCSGAGFCDGDVCVTDGSITTGTSCDSSGDGPNGTNSFCGGGGDGFCEGEQCVTDSDCDPTVENCGTACSFNNQGSDCTSGQDGYCDPDNQTCVTGDNTGGYPSCNTTNGDTDCESGCNDEGQCVIGGSGDSCDVNGGGESGGSGTGGGGTGASGTGATGYSGYYGATGYSGFTGGPPGGAVGFVGGGPGIGGGTGGGCGLGDTTEAHCDGNTCVPGPGDGLSCTASTDCGGEVNNGGCNAVGQCVAGMAGSGNNCGSDEDCYTGWCDPDTNTCSPSGEAGGLACSNNEQCGGGVGAAGATGDGGGATGDGGGATGDGGGDGTCDPTVPGQSCNDPNGSGCTCSNTGETCTADGDCAGEGGGGGCAATNLCSANSTGPSCTTGEDCAQGTDGHCSYGTCVPGTIGGESCTEQSDCDENTGTTCNSSNQCVQGGGGVGCTNNNQCGYSCNSANPSQCVQSSGTPSSGGGGCNPANNGSDCTNGSHLGCSANLECVTVQGSGSDACGTSQTTANTSGGPSADCEKLCTQSGGKVGQDATGKRTCILTGDKEAPVDEEAHPGSSSNPLGLFLNITPFQKPNPATPTGAIKNPKKIAAATVKARSFVPLAYNIKKSSTNKPQPQVQNSISLASFMSNHPINVKLTVGGCIYCVGGGAGGAVVGGRDHCGDGVCDNGEETGCPEDCTYCGDGTCDANEDSTNCANDCGAGGGGDTCETFGSVSIYIIKGLNQNSEIANNSNYAGDGVSFYEDGGSAKKGDPRVGGLRLVGPRSVDLNRQDIGNQFTYISPDKLLLNAGFDPLLQEAYVYDKTAPGKDMCKNGGSATDTSFCNDQQQCISDGSITSGISCDPANNLGDLGQTNSDCGGGTGTCDPIMPGEACDDLGGSGCFCSNTGDSCTDDTECTITGGGGDSSTNSKEYPCASTIDPRGNFLTILYSQNEKNGSYGNQVCDFFTSKTDDIANEDIVTNNKKIFEMDVFPLTP